MKDTPIVITQNNENSLTVGIGKGKILKFSTLDDFNKFESETRIFDGNYIFSALSYDLKNAFENLQSDNFDGTQVPLAIFYIPENVYKVEGKEITTLKGTTIYKPQVQQIIEQLDIIDNNFDLPLKPRTQKSDYFKEVNQLKKEIQLGNIYEINYCQEFYNDNFELKDSLPIYSKWRSITKAPFSTYFKVDNIHIISGSPELYIKKKNNRLISSPIKGTKGRGKNKTEDLELIEALKNDPKEVSENVMIVDLVRNDLSQIASKASVQVDELCKIYTFETVHQMISTISCDLRENTSFLDILKATFPMGSMTGAPKINAMKLIEKHENFKRGFYSGSVGLIQPNGDFDLNVVIRSLIYNSDNKYLSCSVGGAITIKSTAENEYEECSVKIDTILNKMRGTV